MEIPWQAVVAAAGAVVTAIGGAARWVFDRFDKLQKAFLESLEELQQAHRDELAKRDEREEKRREQHLTDIKFAKDQFYEATRRLKVEADSRRPPSEHKP